MLSRDLQEVGRHQSLEQSIADIRLERPETLNLRLGQDEARHFEVFGPDEGEPIPHGILVTRHGRILIESRE